MHGSTESESILLTTKVFAHSIFFELHESILGLNSSGRLGEASVKHHFPFSQDPPVHWHIAPIPSPAFAICMCLPNFCLLYCTISFAFVDVQEYLGLAAGDSTIPASTLPGVYFRS